MANPSFHQPSPHQWSAEEEEMKYGPFSDGEADTLKKGRLDCNDQILDQIVTFFRESILSKDHPWSGQRTDHSTLCDNVSSGPGQQQTVLLRARQLSVWHQHEVHEPTPAQQPSPQRLYRSESTGPFPGQFRSPDSTLPKDLHHFPQKAAPTEQCCPATRLPTIREAGMERKDGKSPSPAPGSPSPA